MKKPQALLFGAVLLGLMAGAAAGCGSSYQAVQPGDDEPPEVTLPTPTGLASPTRGPLESPSADNPQETEAPGPSPTDTRLPFSLPIPTEAPPLDVTQQPEVDRMDQDEAVALAKQALAQRLSIAVEEIETTWVGPATWPDTSLGCPQKGVVYLPVIIQGYRVLLHAGGQDYEVHVGNGKAVICAETHVQLPALERASDVGRVYEMARQDLAGRLGVSVEEIQARLIRLATWPDGSLGCPTAGETYPPQAVEGYIVELEFGGRMYEYHSDGERVVLCEEP